MWIAANTEDEIVVIDSTTGRALAKRGSFNGLATRSGSTCPTVLGHRSLRLDRLDGGRDPYLLTRQCATRCTNTTLRCLELPLLADGRAAWRTQVVAGRDEITHPLDAQ
jgi:hypothetical protein